MPWRVGRKVGRTIYQQVGPEPSDDDVLIGVMDTPELAYEVVRTRNAFWPMPHGPHEFMVRTKSTAEMADRLMRERRGVPRGEVRPP